MTQRITKALAQINNFLDDEYGKLYDKCKKMELSHNRMRNLLKMSKAYVEKVVVDEDLDFATLCEISGDLHRRLVLELYGLEGYVGLTKTKGVKHEKYTNKDCCMARLDNCCYTGCSNKHVKKGA